MDNKKQSYLELHLAVLLWGFTAILGKVISLEEIALVWWRVAITCLSLLCFKAIWKEIPTYSKTLLLKMMGIGVIVAIHWVLFFGSVKYSNVSICLVCMATASLFASILEPILRRQKPNEKMIGVYMGLVSAMLAALFSILNKMVLDKEDGIGTLPMTFVELGSGLLFLSIIFPLSQRWLGETPFLPSNLSDIGYLLILALVCTTLGYVLGLRALRHLSAFASTLVVNLEPVYGIILAWIFFQENKEVGDNFYWGVIIILFAVFIHPFLTKKLNSKNKSIN